MKKISKYFKGVAQEARRIRWPNKTILWSSVGVVRTITVISALALLGCDFITAQILKAFDNAFPSSSTSAVAAVIDSVGGLL